MTASNASWRLMPSLEQSVATRTRCSCADNSATRSSRSAGGRVPVTATTSVRFPSFSRKCSATYSAVAMKRQKHGSGRSPSARDCGRTGSIAPGALIHSPLRVLRLHAPVDRRRRSALSSWSSIRSHPRLRSRQGSHFLITCQFKHRRDGQHVSLLDAGGSDGRRRLRDVGDAAAGLNRRTQRPSTDHQRTRRRRSSKVSQNALSTVRYGSVRRASLLGRKTGR